MFAEFYICFETVYFYYLKMLLIPDYHILNTFHINKALRFIRKQER